MAEVQQVYDDRTKDLLLSVLIALGGSMQDVKPYYQDTRDDILYAILVQLQQPQNAQKVILVDRYKINADNPNRENKNYPGIIGANGVLVAIGGMFIDHVQTDLTRYFLADTVTGIIDMPPVATNEWVQIFKY
jgi:hypothetical protein